MLDGLQPQTHLVGNPFFYSTRGQALFEAACSQWETRGGGRELARKALSDLLKGQSLDPGFAYTYYSLPRVQALLARMDLAQRLPAQGHLLGALQACRQGVAINPANAALQLAAADVHLAEAQVRLAQREDAAPAWAACRAALAAGERANPRDYRLVLLRAELEVAEATAGPETRVHQLAAQSACRAGLRLKGDAPRFRQLLQALASPGSLAQTALTLQ